MDTALIGLPARDPASKLFDDASNPVCLNILVRPWCLFIFCVWCFVYSFLLHTSDAYMMIHRASRCQDSLCQAETFHVMRLVSPLQQSVHYCPLRQARCGTKNYL
ncbi:hypothetical protein BDW69DRAFT_167432, partial [Aspergillus filifer]